MQVNLRKAFAIETALASAARSVSITKTLTLSIYEEDVIGKVNSAVAQIGEKTRAGIELHTAAIEVRALIGAANETIGINTLLREQAGIDALLGFMNGAGSGQTEVQISLIQRKLNAQKARADAGTDRIVSDTISTTLGDPALVEELNASILKLKRRKVEITDKLAALNASSSVTIPEAVVALIEKYSLVV